jgi:glycosyltransferase involved in cell wall biosynthesis
MLSVIIPVFNEEGNLAQVLTQVKAALKEDCEILLIDDGSADSSADIAKSHGAVVFEQPYRMGNGAAIKRGIREARGEILIFMDGDGQHNPSDIPRLLGFIDKYDMSVGARTGSCSSSLSRRFANKIYNWLASYVTGFKVEDLTSGFRAIRRDTALKFVYLLPNSFSYPTTLTMALLKSGRSIKYVPVTTLKRNGVSKVRPLSDGIRFLLIIAKIATLFSPFKVFLPVSAFFLFLGIGNYTYTFLTLHRFTNMSALLITTSVIIFMLGLISEQIAQLRFIRSEDNSPDL